MDPGSEGKQKSLFSQVTFIANKNDSLLSLDDADFWAKALPKEHTRIGRIKTLFTCPESLKLLKGQQRGQETAQGVKSTKKAKLDAWKRFMPIVTEISDLRISGEKPFETEEVCQRTKTLLLFLSLFLNVNSRISYLPLHLIDIYPNSQIYRGESELYSVHNLLSTSLFSWNSSSHSIPASYEAINYFSPAYTSFFSFLS